jgi:hypothetical protein
MKLRTGQALLEGRLDQSGVFSIVLNDKDERFARFGHDSSLLLPPAGGETLGVLAPTYPLILSLGSGDVQAPLVSVTATAGGLPSVVRTARKNA